MNEIYQLFILGELMDEPHHGYLLFSTLNKIIGPMRSISWGMLYPLIHKMEKQGWIEPAPQQQVSGHPRKSYAITASGKERFFQLMARPIGNHPEYELHAWLKFVNFDQIGTRLQREIINDYHMHLKFIEDFISDNLHEVKSKSAIPAQEKMQIESMSLLRLQKLKLEQDWLELQAQALTKTGGH
ncbi:MAG: PadR family transcriptional regulator [Sporolactobacillus sp.]